MENQKRRILDMNFRSKNDLMDMNNLNKFIATQQSRATMNTHNNDLGVQSSNQDINNQNIQTIVSADQQLKHQTNDQ